MTWVTSIYDDTGFCKTWWTQAKSKKGLAHTNDYKEAKESYRRLKSIMKSLKLETEEMKWDYQAQ